MVVHNISLLISILLMSEVATWSRLPTIPCCYCLLLISNVSY